jgi:acylphosphatase
MAGQNATDNAKSAGAFFARIRGRVQGVGFRYSAYREAARLGLTGWVRNTPGREVELWAEGPNEDLAIFLRWLRQGPPRARVDAVDVENKASSGMYRAFSIE